MAIWLTSGAEVLLQMMTGLGIYIYIYRENIKIKTWIGAGGLLLLFIIALEIYNTNLCVLSVLGTWNFAFLESIWLWKAGLKNFREAIYWCIFYKWMFTMTKLPVLIISGLVKQRALPEVINQPNVKTALAGLGITVIIYILNILYREQLKDFLKEFLERHRNLFLIIGIIEFFGIVYVLNVLEIRFEFYVLVLAIILLVMLVFFMSMAVFYLRYQKNEKEKQMLLLREQIMEDNYALLKKEQEENRRHIHEFRHELEYLYQCLRRQEYEAGELYLEKKSREIGKQQKEQLWTGSGCIDFLVNKTRVQAGEKGIRFESEVNVLEIPIEEYDLFMIMSNLLENAVEAAQQCEEGERYIRLQIFTVNRMFFLLVENSYEKEPEERDGRFVTSKGDRSVHGWGLENVKETVKRYGGECEIRYGNQVFSFRVILGI